MTELTKMAYCFDEDQNADSHDLSEEIELLMAIYINEVKLQGSLERPNCVTVNLHPSTGSDDHKSKYVCLNLSLAIPDKYPRIPPVISIKNPRGLSEAHVVSIQENLISLANEKIGSPMLFDLIEYAKECLSDNNIPSCPCVICMEHFDEDTEFVKTECYHYFHVACLSKYVDHCYTENGNLQIVCPMCRLDITFNKNDYTNIVEEVVPFVYIPDAKELEAQARRHQIFEYQRKKGGIIDIDVERNRYLIEIKDSMDVLSAQFGQKNSITQTMMGIERKFDESTNCARNENDKF